MRAGTPLLQRLYIDNYRCFVNFDLTVDPLVLLVGANGVGKSALMDVLQSLRRFSRGEVRAEEAFPPDSLTWWHNRDVQSFELDVAMVTGTYHYGLRLEHERQRDTCHIVTEELLLDGQPLLRFVGGDLWLGDDRGNGGAQSSLDWTRSGLSFVMPRRENTELMGFRDWLWGTQVLRLNPFAITPVADREDEYLAPDGRNLAAWYRARVQSDPTISAKLVDLLQPVIPGLINLPLRQYGNSRMLDVVVADEDHSDAAVECFVDRLSDGQRALLVLHAVYLDRLASGGLVCLDEPDNFVALAEIEPWLDLMRTAVEDGRFQLMVASHHPEVLNRLAPRHAVVLSRDGVGPARAKRFDYSGDEAITPAEIVARGWVDGAA